MPSQEEINELERKKGLCYCKAVFVSPQSDGTTVVSYSHDGLFQTVVYDKSGKMIKGKIKTIEQETGFTNAQVDYFTNETGKKCWMF